MDFYKLFIISGLYIQYNRLPDFKFEENGVVHKSGSLLKSIFKSAEI